MKRVALLASLALASGCSSPRRPPISSSGSSTAAADTMAQTDAVSLIMDAYRKKQISADSAAQALFIEAARSHQPLHVEMDPALRAAVTRAIQAHNASAGGSHP